MRRLVILAALIASPLSAQTGIVRYYDDQGVLHDVRPSTPLPTTGSGSGGATGVSGTAGAITDGSGTIAAANTSQQVFAANTSRKYLMCQNPTTATEVLEFKVGAAAGAANGSIDLAPGGIISFMDTFIPSGTVNVFAATVSHRYSCWQG